MCSSTASTASAMRYRGGNQVGHRGGEAWCARRVPQPQRGLYKGMCGMRIAASAPPGRAARVAGAGLAGRG
jgi:hypothetical protein